MSTKCQTIWRNARIATMAAGPEPYGMVERGCIASSEGRIVWVGSENDCPSFAAENEIDLGNRLVTPGLIDCHTHLVYGGNRAREFERRLEGVSYEEIARSGGGILSTVNATRESTEDDLFRQALVRLDRLIADGVTTIEIKSGYGLDVVNELKMLRVARRLGHARRIRIKTTFLGAHALPPEAEGDADTYISNVCREQLPAVVESGLADAVDVFCENIGFTLEQTRMVFEAARNLGLPVKIHAEQLSDLSGAALAAEFGALSADHLEYVNERSVAAMAEAGTVAVLLPGAFYFLREKTLPPFDLFRRYRVPMAVATDCNPGSSPMTSLLLAANMACTLFRLAPVEALAGVTCHAAKALSIEDTAGRLSSGMSCDFAVWDVEHPAELVYGIGHAPLYQRIFEGEQ